MADPEAQARYQKLFDAELGALLTQGHTLLNEIVEWLNAHDIDPSQVSYPLFRVDTDPKTNQRSVTFTCLVNEQPVKIPAVPRKLELKEDPRTPVDDPSRVSLSAPDSKRSRALSPNALTQEDADRLTRAQTEGKVLPGTRVTRKLLDSLKAEEAATEAVQEALDRRSK